MLKAVEYIHTGAPYEALPFLEKAYALKRDQTVNMLYTSTLVQTENYKKAKTIVDDMPEFYKKDDKRCLLYVSILIKNHLFLQAEVMIQRKLKETHSPFYKEWINQKRHLRYEREQEELVMRKEQKALIKKLYALADFSLEGQLQVVDEAKKLDLDALNKTATVIFGHPYIHVLVKAAFLQLLIQNNDSSTYEYEWFDEERKVIPAKLHLFDETPLIIEIRERLKETLEKNPSLYENIQPEIEFHLMKLFPFIEEVISDAQAWIDLYIDLYANDRAEDEEWSASLDKDQKQMLNWIKRLSELPF